MKMATLDAPEPVNLVRSIFLCNLFNFFLAASKACLIPFLTIYLKRLGLSATQTGLIIGAKTLIGLVFAPLWSKCAVRCGRRRCVLMFSIFIMAVTYLSLTAVPSIDEEAFAAQCANTKNNFNVSQIADNFSKQTTAKPALTTSVKPALTLLPNASTENTGGITQPAGSNVTGTSSKNVTDLVVIGTSSPSENVEGKTTKTEVNVMTTVSTSKSTTVAPTTTAQIPQDQRTEQLLRNILVGVGMPEKKIRKLNSDELMELINDLIDTKAGEKLFNEAIDKLSPEDKAILAGLSRRRKRAVDADKDSGSDSDTEKDEGSESAWRSFRKKLVQQYGEFRDHIRATENEMFVVVLVILMVGESICCPIEKLADDGWFEFLESIDDMEKYGMQRIWSTLAYILVPVIVTLIVDNTNCLFGLSIHPFMLHFYLFAGFLGLTFLLAFFYPMVTSEKYKYASKVMKGMRVVCCNMRSLMFTVTLLIMGVIYSSYYNFLFWLLFDMGSKEVTFGVCIMIAALSEIPMLLFNDRLIKKVGNGGVIAISLLILSARCLYYSFLPTPWAVIPAEVTHAFTHTAMWWAVLSSPSFNTSPALSRSIRSILSSIYFGLGFAFGSIISGVIYENYGPAILFQAGAVLSVGWFPVLCLGVRCCKEKDRSHVKYTRLLNSDDASDDSDSMEDDWLEQALKDR
ncbi:major facilitator superfamily domain-containing protein 6-like protein A [Mercenaria mercenaria]|uniref:major facilitator superfamily domain-containing protein 6-like protein A n=1 Tax=Mercenaria mercenaria TaxID=6596 RepID=UPI00234F5B37|nr:major facilitator superfamily domain-containing protein 6-like protein A [Mercenaria mercenaria]